MVQARFPRTEARQELGFTPSTAVRARIDTRTGAGAVGAAISAAGAAVIGKVRERSERRKALEAKRQKFQDTNATIDANSFTTNAINRSKAFRKGTTDTKIYEQNLKDELAEAQSQISQLSMSDDARITVTKKFQAESSEAFSLLLIDQTNQDANNTREKVVLDITEAVRTGVSQDLIDAVKRFRKVRGDLWPNASIAKAVFESAVEAGKKGKEDDAINATHAAIEEASTTGNFNIAKELATNPSISEARQTILRNTIKTAENTVIAKAKDAQTALVDKTTSDTLREFFAGDLTVPELNKRHSAELVKDSEFKFMMSAFQDTTPANSDPFAASRIRRAQGDFEAGDITQAEVEKRIVEDYVKLDGPDRSKVLADLEDISTRVIGTARTNAYSEGRGLMSVQFVGIKSQDDLFDLFAATTGLTEDEKKRINRRWQAEVSNRDLYERAVDDRFREMRKDGITDTQKFQAESLRILLQYQRRKRLTLEALETEIGVEQQAIIKGSTVNKPVQEMTTAEKQAELQRIRELKQLAR